MGGLGCLVHHPVQRCSFLHHQTIGRDVLNAKGKRFVDVSLPVVKGFAREAEHEVDADISKASLSQSPDCFNHLMGVVTSMEKAKPFVGEGLCTHADTVDGELRQGGNKLICDVVGIAFDGDFPNVFKSCLTVRLKIYLIYIMEKLAQVPCRQLAGRSAADVDGVDAFHRSRASSLPRLHVPTPEFHLATYGINITVLQMQQGSGIKTAVDASAGTKGDVNV